MTPKGQEQTHLHSDIYTITLSFEAGGRLAIRAIDRVPWRKDNLLVYHVDLQSKKWQIETVKGIENL